MADLNKFIKRWNSSTNQADYIYPKTKWSAILDSPTTLAGYGITDAKIESGTITLGSNTITPITSHQSLSGYLQTTLKGAANGLAELDANGKVPSSQLPSYVDDVLEYTSSSNFPATGETGKIYVATNTNLTYRWTGSTYVEISPSLALGNTSSTAFRGDYGNTAYSHASLSGNVGAKTSGLYKITTDKYGHVTDVDAVVKSDITALGIPGSDTNTWRPVGTGSTDAAAGNHTHTASLATDTGTSAITLAYGGKYKLTAGGSSVIFTMPASDNTNTWRGMQNNLTTSSSSTSDSLSAYQGYLLANGSARDNTKLPLTGGTLTGILDLKIVPLRFLDSNGSEIGSIKTAQDSAHSNQYRPYFEYSDLVSGFIALRSDIPSSLPASDVYSWAKASSKPSYSYSEISGTPSSLPASDVYSWAKASTKPSYTYSEVGAAAASHNHDGRYIRFAGSAADANAMSCGTLTAANGYTILSHAASSDGGDWGMAYKSGQIFMQLDGYYYQNEGTYRCLDTSDIGSSVAAKSHTHNYLSSVSWGDIDNKPSSFTPSSHTHTKSQITDFPSSMPASDVYAWAKASTKPSYSALDISYGSNSNVSDALDSLRTAGYITGINSTMVINALGYTPGTSNFTGYTSSNKLSTSYIQNDAGWSSFSGYSSSNKLSTNYIKNDAGWTSNSGTVTSVSVKMNGSVKGTVSTSGTIDLGTVLTSHQSLAGCVKTSDMSTAYLREFLDDQYAPYSHDHSRIGYSSSNPSSGAASGYLQFCYMAQSTYNGLGSSKRANTIYFLY